jgi:hypothetical protein
MGNLQGDTEPWISDHQTLGINLQVRCAGESSYSDASLEIASSNPSEARLAIRLELP